MGEAMTLTDKPQHTSGLLTANECRRDHNGFKISISVPFLTVAEVQVTTNPMMDYFAGPTAARATARLLMAGWNAFDCAALALNCNAVELAERMQDGQLADLVLHAQRVIDRWDGGDLAEAVRGLAHIVARIRGEP
jgi:hypothetical protein